MTERRPDALAAAVRACEGAAREEPDTARFPHRIGLALLALGRPAEARAPLARAMEHGYAGGYREIALGRAEGTFAPAWPKDEADAISIASEGIARTGSPELKRVLGSLLLRVAPSSGGDAARGEALLRDALAADNQAAAADLAESRASRVPDGIESKLDNAGLRPLLEGAVAAGSRTAAYVYGRLLDHGTGLPQDLPAARRLYLLAAERGDMRAMQELAAMMRLGDGGEKDIDGQRRWLARASALGSLKARQNLANSFLDETPTRSDTGIVFLERLADDGSVDAARGLGIRFQEGHGVMRDYARALVWFRRAADAGDGRAMKQIGQAYDDGEGVPVDHAEARRWYDRAREKGVAEAYTAIGMQYDHAQGVPRDYARAFEWYRQGAEHGASAAMNNLGYAYANGRGVPVDLKQAVRWYQAAVDQNDRTAQLNLANLYFKGRGVAQDKVRGLKLLQQAAEQGLPQALNDLALMEYRRPGGSGARAVNLLRQAAAAGAAVAYNNLGMALTQGWDGAPDYVEASYWFRQSIDHRSDLDPLAFSESQFQLGYNLLTGRGGTEDVPAARALILAAAQARNPTALAFLTRASKAMKAMPGKRTAPGKVVRKGGAGPRSRHR
ncbi:SEL1-like repeat protein [Methylobacterium ajmalii]|uniref:TPR repeat, SEL1 subfamily n=3 Tax=Methylobacterium TaxID=407 RepID=A0A0C6FR72_9HYPH|nr:TPR repeat, SEL1 subfamily [Methylobacterium aquaticum]